MNKTLRVTETYEFDPRQGPNPHTSGINRNISINADALPNEREAVSATRDLLEMIPGWHKATLSYQYGRIEFERRSFHTVSEDTSVRELRESNTSIKVLDQPVGSPRTGAMVDVVVKEDFARDRNNILKVIGDITEKVKEQGRSLRFTFQGVASVVEKGQTADEARNAYFQRYHNRSAASSTYVRSTV